MAWSKWIPAGLAGMLLAGVAWGGEGEGKAGKLKRYASRTGRTYVMGKKPYPAGTREKWIAEGRVLGTAPEGALPRKRALKGAADNRGNLPPIGDQGSEGSCVHWAGTYYAKTANMKNRNPSLNVAALSNQCSPRFTYNLSNAGQDTGGYGHEPFEIFMRYGVASLRQRSYVDGQYTILPTVADFVEGLHRRTTNYVWLWQWNPGVAQIAELKAFLDAGGVAVCGVYSSQASFDNWSAGDAPWSGAACTANDIDHMMAVVGYDTGYYLLVNSWGTSFGSNGYIRVASSYFENYVSDVMYPLEGTYEPATRHAELQITHPYRSDLRSLMFTVNGTVAWSNAPTPRDEPQGGGTFLSDSRNGLAVAVDLTGASWGTDNDVAVRVRDQASSDSGSITDFAVVVDGTRHVSTDTPVAIPDNTGAAGMAVISFTGTPGSWDQGYTSLAGGWRRLSWFGDYIPMGDWIFHNQHGFWYPAAGSTPADIWFYAADLGWLWTASTTYPFLYRSSDGAWLWYNGSTSPRWFRNMTAGTWESWP